MTNDIEEKSSKLAARVEHIERLIRSGAKAGGFSLAGLLETAQAQLDQRREEDAKALETKKYDEHRAQQNAIAMMVERETKLNDEEKKRYESLLQKEYFTKEDFQDLDHFYAHSYEKLSNEGKAEMHARIEEGIRRGEFRRDELPKSVRALDENSRAVEGGANVQAGRSTKVPDQSFQSATTVNALDPSDQKGAVASLRYATESDPAKLQQVAAKAKSSVPSDSLQGLELAFDDSSEPSKPTAAASEPDSKGHSI